MVALPRIYPASLSLLGLFAVPDLQAETQSALALPATAVTSDYSEQNYKPTDSRSALKIDAPLRDIPQTVNVIPQSVIKDQGAQSMEDVLKNVPGVGLSNGDGQRDQVTIRGFSAIGDMYVDGVRDDALYFRDLSNVERVEVIKGPAAVLYGRGSSGGLINSISKKPNFTPKQEVGVSFDSEGKKRTQFDASWADQQQNDKAFRVTGALENSDTFRDDGYIDRKAIAPSAYFKLSDDLELNLGATYLYDKRLIDFGIPARGDRPVDVDRDKRFGSADPDDDYTRSEVFSFTAGVDYRINDDFTLSNTSRYYHYDLDRNNTLADSSPTRFVTAPNGELLVKLNRGNVQRKEDGWFNQTELKQQTTLAGMNHNLLYGVELGRQIKDQSVFSQNNVARVPVYRDGLVDVPFQANRQTAKGTTTQDTAGFYVQDLIELTPQWKALLGVRYDVFDQEYSDDLTRATMSRTDNTWSPRAGLVYQPDQVQSYYISVSRSYQPSSEVFALSTTNQDLEPEQTTNFEIGGKWDLLDNRLALTAALFRLERTNMKTTDPANPTKLVLSGEQRTDGLELTASGQLSDKWQVYAGYAYLDAEIIKSNNRTNGVANEGQTPTLTPRHSANLWLVRSLTNTWRVGMGANYVDDRYTALDNQVVMPAYTTVDAALLYNLPKWDMALRLRNVFDKDYYASAHGSVDLITPGAPRTLELSTNYRF
ncbi:MULTISPECIES: TonB-dependent receptor [unclassified Pseudomonas]|uniref:TonB-dependent receptor n=1 Tax=unclassified Pseudomonas TaxID=196821 RepID=UPI001912A350|nr:MULTISPECIES: TonB-dependent siderophore receptor [Gammaproteobacteria]MBK5309485.1 TonB-dependent siderophore receptor [Pseudomonas sp. TH71]MBK5368689.1 TonB-dependent siderophore receptor [Pseudomonas sp. TH40]MBK5379858.1 TonB-dependent siderophore receptor [Pseudomonas sp. TH35]MBK5385317.1 TonB-dependent siderophore receptor [Pseudomonas sp. TH38]MBK5402612.1 TonB-dependent siderophore receptor [Pseudomonas sp. TH37]